MTDEDIDKRISQLLLRNAPPERDPLFRIKVLERREHQRFRRSLLQLIGTLLTIAVALAVASSIGGGSGGTHEVARVGLFALAAGVAAALYAPLFARLFRASIGRLGSD